MNKLLARAREIAAHAIENFADRPEWLSGWAHDFVCPACAARLTFVEGRDIPGSYTCPNCGAVTSGQADDEAWVYCYRQRYAESMEAVAACILAGDSDALAFMERYLDFYAAHYAGFPVHGQHAGRGKIMAQSLCEAVWVIAVLRGLYPVREKFDAALREKWYRMLFRPAAELLLPQSQFVHNIPCWIRCAIGMIGITFGDDAMLASALEGAAGIRDQVEKGFTADGLWYEGSLHYHYYTAEGLTYFCAMLADKNPDDPLISRLADIYCAPLALSQDGWTLVSTNDGWYPRTLETYATQIHRAAVLTGDPTLQRQVDKIREKAPEAIAHPYALLIEPQVKSCTLWTETNLAIFDTPLKLILKSGVISSSHRHRDSLSVILPPVSDDLGTPGYAHPLTSGWYRLAASHNCVTVDLEQAGDMYKTHIEAVDGGARAVLDGGWRGVTAASRTVTAEDDGLADVMELVCDGVHTIDWLLHLTGVTVHSGMAVPCEAVGGANGYENFKNVRRIVNEGSFMIRAGGFSAEIFAEGDIYLADSPGNPADNLRTTVIVRHAEAASAKVRAVYRKD